MTDEARPQDVPPGIAELVRSLDRPPPLPRDLRAEMRASVLRRTQAARPAPRWIAPGVLAAAVLIAGITVWVVKRRVPEPEPGSDVAIVSVLETPDAGMGWMAPPPPAVGPDAGVDAATPETRRPRRRADAGLPPITAPHVGVARLTLASIPWAHVLLDGEDRGWITPVPSTEVPAGHHVLTFITPDGVHHDVQVDLEAGETTRVIRSFAPPPR